MEKQEISVAVLDLYNNEANEGMRGILSILKDQAELNPHIDLTWKRFDVRHLNELPDTSYDIYISSGGPGSPLEDPDAKWEKSYFKLMDDLLAINKSDSGEKKYIFLICHSFQLMCRHLGIGTVSKRKSTAFGIFPMHKLTAGFSEVCFEKIPDPFYAVDSRDYQVTQPNHDVLKRLGAHVLAIEKERPHVPYERAIMGVRFTPEMIGTQFHPEADPVGMLHYLMREDKKDHICKHHGQDKFDEMTLHLNDDDKIKLTKNTIIPEFLKTSIDSLIKVTA
jgi:homoserine O-succinyltransferase/O-acetyltransferase